MDTKFLPDSPSPGHKNKWVGVLEVVGPVLYAAGTGQSITAQQLGLGGIEFAGGGMSLSESGTYFVRDIEYLPAAAASARQGQAATSVRFKWFVSASGLEAAAIDLSGEVVRLLIVGV